MAYQNVGTPTFYIDHGLWLNSLGLIKEGVDYILGDGATSVSFISPGMGSVIHLNPVNQVTVTSSIRVPRISPMNYVAYLGHNSYSTHGTLATMYPEFRGDSDNQLGVTLTSFINGQHYNNSSNVEMDGFSIFRFDDNPSADHLVCYIRSHNDLKIGAISAGYAYKIPHSPELKLTMSREMDGVKRERTKGGNDLVHHKYFRSPKWGNLPAWEQSYNATNPPSADYYSSSRVGRRTWNLSFNYMQGSDMFGPNESLGYYLDSYGYFTMTDTDSDTINSYGDDASYTEDIGNYFNSNLLTDDNFFSQVIHKTNGGQLPFIFQPDSNNNNPDQFAICKFDIKRGFQFKQVANGIYSIALKIREVW